VSATPVIKPRDLMRVLKQLGFEEVRSKGSHLRFADTALRLSRFFSTTPEFWMNLQSRFDLETAADRLRHRIEREVTRFAA